MIYQLRKIGITGDDHDQKDDVWEINHFVIQHGRIVKNNEPNLIRLMQIAYNAGQKLASVDQYPNEMLPKIDALYNQYEMNNIMSYIKDHDEKEIEQNSKSIQQLIETISKIISMKQIGGALYEINKRKYLLMKIL